MNWFIILIIFLDELMNRKKRGKKKKKVRGCLVLTETLSDDGVACAGYGHPVRGRLTRGCPRAIGIVLVEIDRPQGDSSLCLGFALVVAVLVGLCPWPLGVQMDRLGADHGPAVLGLGFHRDSSCLRRRKVGRLGGDDSRRGGFPCRGLGAICRRLVLVLLFELDPFTGRRFVLAHLAKQNQYSR